MQSRKYRKALQHLELDAVVLFVSIIIAYLLVQSGVLSELLTFTQGTTFLSAFVAGIFFTSMFTIAPASIAFAELSTTVNIVPLAFAGALGSVCGDMLLFFFIRDTLTEDLKTVMKAGSYRKLSSRFHGGFFRTISPFVGAIIIASPLPDELGLALMGLAKVRTYWMIPITFVMNFLGIWAVIAIANAL